MIKRAARNKDRSPIVVLWRGEKQFDITDIVFYKHRNQFTEVRLAVCKTCKCELFWKKPWQVLFHPKNDMCPKWEHGEMECFGSDLYYIMGPVQMSDLEPYAYKWRFEK
jgi:hypothetical protein